MTFTITTTFDDRFTTNSPWPAPSPSPSDFNLGRRAMFFLSSRPMVDSAFEIAAVAVILALLLLSFLSISFILHLRFKSRSAHHLQNFSSHWAIRFLLISFISLWSLNEFLRLPFFHRSYVFPFLPPLSVSQQSHFCKLHIILSLGLFEPGFLVTLLFLVNISIKKRSPRNNLSAIIFVALICFPISLLLYLSIYQLPQRVPMIPAIFDRSSVLLGDDLGREVVICTYPLSSAIIFGSFGIVYAFAFLLACWKVVSLAINKRLRTRMNTLSATVLICLTVQIGLLTVSVFWRPDEVWYYVFVLFAFFSVVICAAVGETILVIIPITDALSVGGVCCRRDPSASGRNATLAAAEEGSGRARIDI